MLPAHSERAKSSSIEKPRIPNHYSPALSNLDLRMIRAVPSGGNWKSIPADIPSARLAQIRATFASGNGSRSTYYGRLKPDLPSFTISTCINRPGNGCYIHYDVEGRQDRLISQREAARLQSFPDWFAFEGPRTAINRQIGNAVPPLLAYQVAKNLKPRGVYVDLFCGAGGLSLGFKITGWKPLLAVDVDPYATSTYRKNIDGHVLTGSLEEERTFTEAVEIARKRRDDGMPFYVIGGPPCQGLSTAGNSRTRGDPRNSLFLRFSRFLDETRPDGFVFENVPGILNFDRGRFFGEVVAELSRYSDVVNFVVLNAAEFGVPQRRQRVFLIGTREGPSVWKRPRPVTHLHPGQGTLDSTPGPVSVEEAIGDLPPLTPGQDGSHLEYSRLPATPYQKLMRGTMSSSKVAAFLRECHAGSSYG